MGSFIMSSHFRQIVIDMAVTKTKGTSKRFFLKKTKQWFYDAKPQKYCDHAQHIERNHNHQPDDRTFENIFKQVVHVNILRYSNYRSQFSISKILQNNGLYL